MTTQSPIKETLLAVTPPGLAWLRGPVLLGSLILLTGCALFSFDPDREIDDGTHALQSARNDVERAQAYSKRGVGYADKARVSRKYKVPVTEEYERVYALALKDHTEAIRLNPDSAEIYFHRAEAYYDRGSEDVVEEKNGKPWLDLAAADFEKATQLDPKYDLAFDRLGLTHEASEEFDKAIRDYTQELTLNPLGKQRLADAHCAWGFVLGQKKDYVAAAAEFQKSIEFGIADGDSCRSDPFEALVYFYTNQTHQYDKAWDIIHQALKSGRVITPDLVNKLKKDSGRTF